tara:strand:+ start:554 stop:751 length:198 start_codon:yes stop_codon:yes gene_type:complete
MKKQHLFQNEVTLLVPTEDGEVVEINFKKSDVQEIVAPEPLVENLTRRCTAVATSKEYNLLVLDF